MNKFTRNLMMIALGSTFLLAPTFGASRSFAADNSTEADAKAVPSVVTGVMEQYAKIQTALAKDSTGGVADAAQAIAKQVTADTQKTLPAEVATQAEALAKTKDLAAAREAFKPLSESLADYLAKAKLHTGHYFQVHCPMAKADWLQTDKTVANPYYGSSMLRCGKVVATY